MKITKDALLSCGIQMVFLFELEIISTKMIVVNDLLANWNLIFSLNLQRRNHVEMKMGDKFLVIGQNIY